MIPRRLLSGGAQQQPWSQTAVAALRSSSCGSRPAAAGRRLQLLSGPAARRWTSTEQRPYSSFFKTFGRPIAKVSLMAIFTYQVVYYAWTKLAFDEDRADRQAELSALEEQVKELQAKRQTTSKP